MITSFRKRIISLLLAIMMVMGLAAPAFSFTIAVVTTESKYKDGELTTPGDGSYSVTIRYSQEAGIPDGAKVVAAEVTDSEAYQVAAEKKLPAGKTAVLSRFFDIDIVDEAGESVALLAPVEVVIAVTDAPEESNGVSVFHFKDEAVEFATKAPSDRIPEEGVKEDALEESAGNEVSLENHALRQELSNAVLSIEGEKHLMKDL